MFVGEKVEVGGRGGRARDCSWSEEAAADISQILPFKLAAQPLCKHWIFAATQAEPEKEEEESQRESRT